jgi:WD40 repeat protein
MARRYAGQAERFAIALLVCGVVLGHAIARAGEPPTDPVLRLDAGAHTAVINKLAVTRDGKLLTVSDDKTARLWSREGGVPQTIRVPIGPGDEGALYAVAASPVKDSAVVGGCPGFSWDPSGSVYGVDVVAGKITGRLETPLGKVYSLAYSKDGRYLAVGTDLKPAVRVIDLVGHAVVLEDTDYGDAVVAAQFLPDSRLVTGALDGKIRLYDTAAHLVATHVMADKAHPWRIAVAPQGDKIAIGADGATVEVLSTDGLRPITKLTPSGGGGGALRAVAWVGPRVFAAGTQGNSSENRLFSWDLTNGKQSDMTLASNTVSDLVALSDGSIAFSTAEPSLGIFDPQTQRLTWISKRQTADFRDAANAFRVAADGSAVEFPTQQKGRGLFRFDLNEHELITDPRERAGMTAPGGPCGVTHWQNASDPKYQGTPIELEPTEYARSIAASSDCSNILLGADYSLRLLHGGNVIWKIGLQAVAWAVNLSSDKRYAVAALGDGTIHWFDARNGAEVLSLLALRDGRWIVWTKEGYFDHGTGAEGLVGYHINRGKAADSEFVHSGQLYDRFCRPDLVSLKFRGEDLTQTVAETGGDASAIVTKHVAPDLRLVGWCAEGKCSDGAASGRAGDAVAVDTPNVALRVAVTDRGSGIGKVVVKLNGASVPASVTRDPSASQVQDYGVELAPGINHVTVTASDAQHIVDAGAPIAVSFRYQSAPSAAPVVQGGSDLPRLYVLAVGINHYKNSPESALRNAVSDAKGIAQVVPTLGRGLFQPGRTELLTDQEATLANIRAAFQRLAHSARPQDVAIIFLSGHGTAIKGKFYFPVYDTEWSLEGVQHTGLTHEELVSLISSLPAERVAVLIDTCHSGALAAPDVAMHQVPDSVSQERVWTNQLGNNTGRFVLAGAETQETASDGSSDHGLFTAVILKGIEGAADTAPKDNKVNVYELSKYAESNVPLEASKFECRDRSGAEAPCQQHAQKYFAGGDFFDLAAPNVN